MEEFGENLTDRNIRRYHGWRNNRINEGIRATLKSDNHENFYFFNIGLTIICDDFRHNTLQKADFVIKVENMQIINGGQTCIAIFETMQELYKNKENIPINAYVLVRIYAMPKDKNDVISQIIYATNSQTPIDIQDLRSNDKIQRQIEFDLKQY